MIPKRKNTTLGPCFGPGFPKKHVSDHGKAWFVASCWKWAKNDPFLTKKWSFSGVFSACWCWRNGYVLEKKYRFLSKHIQMSQVWIKNRKKIFDLFQGKKIFFYLKKILVVGRGCPGGPKTQKNFSVKMTLKRENTTIRPFFGPGFPKKHVSGHGEAWFAGFC